MRRGDGRDGPKPGPSLGRCEWRKIYPHIEKTPDVRGGKPCIAGTRIAVVDIVLAHEQGLKPEELVHYFSSRPLELSEIHAALAYHHDHREELEQHLRDSERAVQETEAAQADSLRHKSGR